MNKPREKKPDPKPDMSNKLAQVRYDNMRAFMVYRDLSSDKVAKITGLGHSTVVNCFGAKKFKRPASDKTMEKIYEFFVELPRGCLDHVDFDATNLKEVQVPATLPKDVFIQIGRATFYVSPEEAKRMLYKIALDDNG